MSENVKTVKIGNNINYAKVADRLVEFRSKHPRSKIHTEHTETADGKVICRAFIWRDSTELIKILSTGVVDKENAMFSCDANGTATATKQKVASEKGLEKLETIAVGRTLAMLGYAADGNVASFEEMEEFEDFKREKKAEEIGAAKAELESAKNLEELKTIFTKLPRELWANAEIVAKKDEMKQHLGKITGAETTNPAQNGATMKQMTITEALHENPTN